MKEKKYILHITNSYGGTKVYKSLYSEIDKLNIGQQIFVPLNYKNKNRVGNHLIEFIENNSEIFYSTALKRFHRYFYSLKIRTIFNEIIKLDLNNIDLIHASTFCLDGAVAYKLSKILNIPFFVTVRNTDINSYYKKLYWHRSFFHKILLNASKIVFISPSYKHFLINEIIPVSIKHDILEKCVEVPNGVDNIYLENRKNKLIRKKNIKLLYVGGIQENKNIHRTIYAIKLLREKGYDLSYTIIGKSLENRKTKRTYSDLIETLVNENDWIEVKERQNSDELLNSYRLHDIFIMPSITETFGLVYVEALSQGLPIIYTRNQGVDKFYKDGEIGYCVDSKNINAIASKIQDVISNFDKLSTNIEKLDLSVFKWKEIAKKYNAIYDSIL